MAPPPGAEQNTTSILPQFTATSDFSFTVGHTMHSGCRLVRGNESFQHSGYDLDIISLYYSYAWFLARLLKPSNLIAINSAYVFCRSHSEYCIHRAAKRPDSPVGKQSINHLPEQIYEFSFFHQEVVIPPSLCRKIETSVSEIELCRCKFVAKTDNWDINLRFLESQNEQVPFLVDVISLKCLHIFPFCKLQ